MKQELIKAGDKDHESFKNIKSKRSERESGVKNGSHQTNLRYTL